MYIDSLGGRHLNLASDVTGFELVSLGDLIKQGELKGITGIHRIAIERQKANRVERPMENDIKTKNTYCCKNYNIDL